MHSSPPSFLISILPTFIYTGASFQYQATTNFIQVINIENSTELHRLHYYTFYAVEVYTQDQSQAFCLPQITSRITHEIPPYDTLPIRNNRSKSTTAKSQLTNLPWKSIVKWEHRLRYTDYLSKNDRHRG